MEVGKALVNKGVWFPDTIITYERKPVYIVISNYSKEFVSLETSQKLGQWKPLHQRWEARLLTNEECDKAIADHQHAISALAENPKPIIRDWDKEFHLDKTDLNEQEKIGLRQFLDEFRDVCSTGDDDIGKSNIIRHTIETGNALPIRQPLRRINPNYRLQMEEMTQDMLDQGIIVPSISPWASPVLLVPKKDGKLRFCVDYRKLNAVTKGDAFPMPRIFKTLECLQGNSFYSTIDLCQGYFQLEMDPASAEKTAFSTNPGLYQFTRMAFGLRTAPSTFSRLINAALHGLLYKICLVYLDDIIIPSSNFQETLSRLRQVFLRLRQAGLKLKPSKCVLFKREVKFLGHVVNSKGISTDKDKTIKVENWPTPTNGDEVLSFLGLTGYYRRFVKDYAKLAHPLYQVSHLDKHKFVWEEAQQTAFENLKKALTSPPILAYPIYGDDAGTFCLDTDACDTGLGAVLSQWQDGNYKVIAYGSRTLNKAQQNYATTKKEMLAIIYFVEYWKHYLMPKHFIIRTDHSAIQWLQGSKNTSKIFERWMTILDAKEG